MPIERFHFGKMKQHPPTLIESTGIKAKRLPGFWVVQINGTRTVVEIAYQKENLFYRMQDVYTVHYAGSESTWVFGLDTFEIKLIRKVRLS